MDSIPIHTDLVLIGGGHSHAIVLHMWGMHPLPGVRLTLISEASDTPYSGMVPGYISGFYTRDQCYIDLRKLANFAGADFYIDRVTGINPQAKEVLCAHRPPVRYDFLSIDLGSRPEVPEAVRDPCVIPAKPIRYLLERWEKVRQNPPKTVAIVGGGIAGLELCLSLQQQLPQSQFHLLHSGSQILPGHNPWVRQRAIEKLTQRGVAMHCNSLVTAVSQGILTCRSGYSLHVDVAFWVTQASAPPWLQESGLTLDTQGFIGVHPSLQSISHPDIFAAGDIATILQYPRPKAGVFAVRQGKPLWENLRRRILGQPLQHYIPQNAFLCLIGTADGSAIASWGGWGWEGTWVWRWKDYIDRRFMQRFQELPRMTRKKVPLFSHFSQSSPVMYCAGCGAKVGSNILHETLQRLQEHYPKNIASYPDDAAIGELPPGKLLVQTVDHFPRLINDPYVFGQITAHHCLSDIYAMGATPQSILAMVTIPHADRSPTGEMLYQLLAGVLQVLEEAGAVLVGGHTIAGEEMVLGLAVQGYVTPNCILSKKGMQVGDKLILTKPLGIGTLFAAFMQGKGKAAWIDEAIAAMLQSNQKAAQIFLDHQASACTDITGFGLAGHLGEMLDSSLGVTLNQSTLPFLSGAITTIEAGIFSTLHSQNLLASKVIVNPEEMGQRYHLLFDPQTSGGLLATVPAELASTCLTALHKEGYTAAQGIGSVVSAYPGKVFLVS